MDLLLRLSNNNTLVFYSISFVISMTVLSTASTAAERFHIVFEKSNFTAEEKCSVLLIDLILGTLLTCIAGFSHLASAILEIFCVFIKQNCHEKGMKCWGAFSKKKKVKKAKRSSVVFSENDEIEEIKKRLQQQATKELWYMRLDWKHKLFTRAYNKLSYSFLGMNMVLLSVVIRDFARAKGNCSVNLKWATSIWIIYQFLPIIFLILRCQFILMQYVRQNLSGNVCESTDEQSYPQPAKPSSPDASTVGNVLVTDDSDRETMNIELVEPEFLSGP